LVFVLQSISVLILQSTITDSGKSTAAFHNLFVQSIVFATATIRRRFDLVLALFRHDAVGIHHPFKQSESAGFRVSFSGGDVERQKLT
jgi:hypothetical protein